MKFTVRRVGFPYQEMTVSEGNASIESGLLNEDEAKAMAAELRSAADDLSPRAAPELLEALETVVAEWDALYPSFPTDTKIEDAEFSGFQMARAAIAKARGSQ